MTSKGKSFTNFSVGKSFAIFPLGKRLQSFDLGEKDLQSCKSFALCLAPCMSKLITI